jgi:Concanavalin A-like lectin/glucanases superfamily/Glycosyl hydrolases family 2, sugar binding domain/Glycosyl hydrolases family 2
VGLTGDFSGVLGQVKAVAVALARVAAVLARAAAYVLGMLALAGALAGALAPPAGATAPYVERFPPLLTPWTRSVSTIAPLPDYPRPQLERSRWLSLNGRWQYEQAQAGQAPPFGQNLAQTILVPFPPQAPLSGIDREDTSGWYRRTFTIPAAWTGSHVQLNFGAVAWAARVYVNGQLAGSHVGDYDSFSLDITRLLRPGPNELVVGFDDPIGAAGEPVGKQRAGGPRGIFHTAASGIWQTVWLEPVSRERIGGLNLVPDLAGGRVLVTAAVTGGTAGRLTAQALAGGRPIATGAGRPGHAFSIRIPNPHAWSPWDPYLYGLRLELLDARGRPIDRVDSYFGMRSISLGHAGGATRILLNGRFVFETGALDQGYWPDGVYTPSADTANRFDILAAKNMGYDMLREHAKVEPDRWYYWADRLGILVWQDMPSMRAPTAGGPTPAEESEFRHELAAIVVQHRSDPSIVTWIPFNEGWDQFDLSGIASEVKRLDPAALVDSDSGSANCCGAVEAPNTDMHDTHLYFGPFSVPADRRATVIGEYGGVLAFPPRAHRWPGTLTSLGTPVQAWGRQPVETFLRAQYSELAQEIRLRGLSGAVFTEESSYEGELGILTYDRRAYTMSPQLLRSLNESLISASERSSQLRPQPPATPTGTAGLWRFGEGRGTAAADTSGDNHPLSLTGGASWTRGRTGSALAITAPGQFASSTAQLIDTSRSFTISVWLNYGVAGESGSAVSEPGPDGSSFSLGVETAALGPGGKPGAGGLPGKGTHWTFIVPAGPTCTAAQCGVRANMRYNDGRNDPLPGRWHLVTGVYDRGSHTIRLYVDGVPEDVEHVFGIPPARGPLVVGAGTDDYTPTDTFLGGIQGLRIYKRSLTPGEVWQLYETESR